MKYCFLFFFCIGIFFQTRSQVPQRLNYQGIARDLQGNPLVKQKIALLISILPSQEADFTEYVESHKVVTSEFGLYSIQIGGGVEIQGKIQDVRWEGGNRYIRVALDPVGGENYQDLGITQLLSVPYAFYAEKSGSAKQTTNGTRASNNFIEKTNGAGIANSTSLLYDNGTSLGLGTISPISSSSLHIKRNTSGQYLYMENTSATGFGSFRLFNDVPANFATFTKYGSAATGGYSGISDKYPYANVLGYGNNGPFLNAGTGNIGFAITKGGTNKLKIHIDAASERVSIGGNATPAANVHLNNTDGVGDTMKLTNNTSGHNITDGLDIIMGGTAARIVNRENDVMTFGTNGVEQMRISSTGNIGIGSASPSAKLEVAGQVKITGGSPGVGKVLTSDGTGLASWQNPSGGGGNVATGNNIGDLMFWNGSNWIVLPVGLNGQTLMLVNGLPTWQGGVNGGMAAVSTTSISSISNVSCTIGGDVTNNGGSTISARGFVYNTNPNPTLANMMVQAGSGLGGFSSAINGLTPATTYYIRAYATNATGTNYGNQVTFSTTTNVPFTIGLAGPAGGYVFYDKGSYTNGWRYLEAAPFDQSTGAVWGCYGTAIGNTTSAVGSGFNNSGLILAGCTSAGIAAYLCDTMIVNGYSDWFLPSRDELLLMYDNLHLFSLGNFSLTAYWTSTENGQYNANEINFANGIYYNSSSKNVLNRVRAIRRF